jgi:hypothetical protein
MAYQPHRFPGFLSSRGDSEGLRAVVERLYLRPTRVRIPENVRLRELGFEGEADRVDAPAFVGGDVEAFASENVPEV